MGGSGARPPDLSVLVRRVVVLKSPRYGPSAPDVALPYRIDLLRRHGLEPVWTDRNMDGAWRRVALATEPRLVPWVQALLTWRARRGAVATLAMFESEGHGLALARRATRRSEPPLVVIGCCLADLLRAGGRRARIYRRLYRSVDAIVVFSSNQRATIVRELGVDPDRIEVVPFGVDLDELADVPTSDDGTVVAAGRDLGRDWATLFEAAAGTGWSTVLITRPEQVADLHPPAEIDFRGTVDRAGYLGALAAAAVVAIPTHVREYPTGQTVLLEAMALGKACVVTDTPAMREYVTDGETGLLVPPGDAGALRAAVGSLLDDPGLRRTIGDAARDHAREHHGAAEMWGRVAGVIERVATPRP